MRTDTAEDATFFAAALLACANAANLPVKPIIDGRMPLRAELRARRAAFSAAERIAAAAALVDVLEQIPQFLTDRCIAGYWAIDGELPLAALAQGLRTREQRYLLPLLGERKQLMFAPWRPGAALATNRYGIPEPVCAPAERIRPEQLDVVLLPLLGFDRRGQRLGFGGGWYDRSFAFLRERSGHGKPVLVGIGYAAQEVPSIEPARWDVRLDYIATERELIKV